MPEIRLPASPSRSKRWRWIGAAVVVLVVVAGAWWYFKPAGGQPQGGGASGQRSGRGGPGGPGGPGAMGDAPVPVRLAQARSQKIDVELRALGTVTAYNTVTVHAKVGGELVKVAFKEGQYVKAGDLLAQVDPRPFQVALDQAKGTLAQTQAQLDNARRDLQRYQTLYKQDSIARQQLDTQAALVSQYEGTVKSNQAAVESAQLQLDYSRIVAPLSGLTGLRQVDQGN
jgi:multidrug efflux system membrane fusion protein